MDIPFVSSTSKSDNRHRRQMYKRFLKEKLTPNSLNYIKGNEYDVDILRRDMVKLLLSALVNNESHNVNHLLQMYKPTKFYLNLLKIKSYCRDLDINYPRKKGITWVPTKRDVESVLKTGQGVTPDKTYPDDYPSYINQFIFFVVTKSLKKIK